MDHAPAGRAGRGRGGHRGRRWLAVGLLLVAVMLGHDALMALGAPHPAVALAASRHHAEHRGAADAAAPVASGPEPGHPGQCGVTFGADARPETGTGGSADPAPAGPPVAPAGPPVAAGPAAASVWEEPRWPPGVVRAFLQVYRV